MCIERRSPRLLSQATCEKIYLELPLTHKHTYARLRTPGLGDISERHVPGFGWLMDHGMQVAGMWLHVCRWRWPCTLDGGMTYYFARLV